MNQTTDYTVELDNACAKLKAALILGLATPDAKAYKASEAWKKAEKVMRACRAGKYYRP